MNTTPSGELVRRAMQDVADWFNSQDVEASRRIDEAAVQIGEKRIKYQSLEKIKDVVVIDNVAVSS